MYKVFVFDMNLSKFKILILYIPLSILFIERNICSIVRKIKIVYCFDTHTQSSTLPSYFLFNFLFRFILCNLFTAKYFNEFIGQISTEKNLASFLSYKYSFSRDFLGVKARYV